MMTDNSKMIDNGNEKQWRITDNGWWHKGKWQTMGNEKQWRITDNGWWQIKVNSRQCMENDKQWEMNDN